MLENKKNIRKELEEHRRYISGEMTAKERNSFERKLQEDPFYADALEGYSQLDSSEAQYDLKQLKGRLSRRTRRSSRRSTFVYRIAAAMIILIGISTVFLLRDLRKPALMIAENAGSHKEESLVKPLVDPSEVINDISGIEMTDTKQKRQSIPDERPAAMEGVGVDVELDEEIFIVEDDIIIEETRDLLVDDIIAAAPLKAVEGEILMLAEEEEADDKGVIAGVIQEELVMKKSARRAIAQAAVMLIELNDADAVPVCGMDEYNNYLLNMQVFPEGFEEMNRAVVKLEFIIKANSIIDSIKVLRSPAEAFSDEAIRLLKEGPEWKPGIKDNEAYDELVSLRLVFRRE